MNTRMPSNAPSPSKPSHSSEAGFTLLAVVAVVFLLSLVIVTLMRTTSSLMTTARSAEEHAAAEYLADGLARLVTRHLSIATMDEMRAGNVPTSGLPIYCKAGTARAAITITQAAGQIDLNQASRELIAFALKGAGMGEADAEKLAVDILDYRTPGDTSLEGDSKSAMYAAARRRYGPKAAPFSSVSELDQLPSVSRDLFQTLSPLFTVHSEQRAVDPLKASLPVALSLKGLGLNSASAPPSDEALAELRRGIALPPELLPPTRTRSTSAIRPAALAISVTVWTGAGARFTREQSLAITPGSGSPGRILEWTQGDTTKTLANPGNAVALPACLGEVLWVARTGQERVQ